MTIQVESKISDGQGGYTAVWSDVAEVSASIEPVKGYERFQAMQTATPVSHKIVMRYRTDLTTKDRLLYDGRIFIIKEILNRKEEKRFLDIKALEQQ